MVSCWVIKCLVQRVRFPIQPCNYLKTINAVQMFFLSRNYVSSVKCSIQNIQSTFPLFGIAVGRPIYYYSNSRQCQSIGQKPIHVIHTIQSEQSQKHSYKWFYIIRSKKLQNNPSKFVNVYCYNKVGKAQSCNLLACQTANFSTASRQNPVTHISHNSPYRLAHLTYIQVNIK